MRIKKYKVRLTESEREILYEIVANNKPFIEIVKRANVLLELDYYSHQRVSTIVSYQDVIASRCGVSTSTVYQISKKFAEQGLDATLYRKKRETPAIQPIVTGDIEARIIALACSEPPPGYARWTLRLLENKVVELGIVGEISDTTIFRTLKKTNLSLI